MNACMNFNVEVIKLLLSIPNLNMHLKDNDGETALDIVKSCIANEDETRALFQGELLPF
jgi:hypothetical protein